MAVTMKHGLPRSYGSYVWLAGWLCLLTWLTNCWLLTNWLAMLTGIGTLLFLFVSQSVKFALWAMMCSIVTRPCAFFNKRWISFNESKLNCKLFWNNLLSIFWFDYKSNKRFVFHWFLFLFLFVFWYFCCLFVFGFVFFFVCIITFLLFIGIRRTIFMKYTNTHTYMRL